MKILLTGLCSLLFSITIFASSNEQNINRLESNEQNINSLGLANNEQNVNSLASNEQTANNINQTIGKITPAKISYMPRLYLGGYAGTGLVGDADLLIPLYQTNEQAFIVYGQGRYGFSKDESFENETWTGSAGLLYRQIVADSAVLGAYVLGDYSEAPSGHNYWVIGPGIESLGRVWDFHLNGYIPVDDKTWTTAAWAQDLGNYNYVEFEEGTNNVYDNELVYLEEAGLGGDAEIGVKLFKVHNTLVKGYLQGYYYNMEDADDVYGGGAKITVQPSRYLTFSMNDTYDNYQHNVFMLGAQIRVNDLFNKSNKPIDENNLTTRLLDPIDRNYASIETGTTGATITGQQVDLGQGLYSSSGVFFSDNGTGYTSPNAASYALGTYGNPYTTERDVPTGADMQVVINNINSQFANPLMYFAPGNYQFNNNGSPVELYNGMSAFGRDYWYTTPTYGDDRPIFVGALIADGNNKLDSIQIYNDGWVGASMSDPYDVGTSGSFGSGITATNASNVVLNNVAVGTQSDGSSYATGISMNNSSFTIMNSDINARDYGSATSVAEIDAYGINMTNGGSLTVSNTSVNAYAYDSSGSTNAQNGEAIGIASDGEQATVVVQDNSYIHGSGSGTSSNSGDGYGILVGTNFVNTSIDMPAYDNTVIVSDSTVYGEGYASRTNGANNAGNGFGIVIGDEHVTSAIGGGVDYSIHDNQLDISNSDITGKGYVNVGIGSGDGYGVLIGAHSAGDSNTNDSVDFSIHDNNINVTNSDLTGYSDTSTGPRSGNGFGLVIGHTTTTPHGGPLDVSIYNNILNISFSNLLGDSSGATPIPGSTNNANNGYGLLIGSMYIESIYPADNVDGSIYNNVINITYSSSEGIGTINTRGSDSGNGYGVLIGYQNLNNVSSSPSDLSIYNNSINIFSSQLSGVGQVIGTGTTLDYSGDSYGLLIGEGHITHTTTTNDFSIYNNNINITNSSLSGTSESPTATGRTDISNSYGMLIGVGYDSATDTTGQNYSITGNTINISDSDLSASSEVDKSNTASGNAYGILIGGGGNNASLAASNTTISGNMIALVDNTVEASSLGSGGLAAYGIAFGLNRTADLLNPNTLIVIDDDISVYASNGTTPRNAYGIYMLTNSGTLVLDDTVIGRTDGGTTVNGYMIVWPDGTTSSW